MRTKSFVAGAALLLLAGCLTRDLGPVAPCVQSGVSIVVSQNAVDKVDVLFMVDNSNSMAEEQNNLAGNFDTMIRALATGDVTGDGMPEFPPVKDLHVGVVSSDMGTAGFPVPTCSDDGDPDGDDGVLITRGNTMVAGCSASYPSFLSFMPAVDNADNFIQQFGCVARIGTGGCGFEQQLESILKAITPAASPAVAPFVSGTGHADGRNAGFLRPDSILALILVSDEEDCSAQNAEIFNTMSGIFPGEALNLRCFMYGAESYQAVHPVTRYVNGYLAAVGGDTSRLIFAAIVGVPPDSVPNPDAVDYDAILAHPNMQEAIDPMDPNRLRTSCNVPGLGIAFPPRRIVEVARQIDQATAGPTGVGNATVQSICQADLRPALRVITNKIGSLLRGACLPRALAPRADGTVDCTVRETIVGGTCSGAPGAPPCTTPAEKPGCRSDDMGCCLGIDPTNDQPLGQLCTIPQRGVEGAAAGWFYDTTGGDCGGRPCTPTDPGYCAQRISFDDAYIPPNRAIVRLECLQAVEGQITCAADTDCPDPLQCQAGVCVSVTCGGAS
ncbi:MAG: hypothetical protein IT379_03110 [Deltaproteobacteria bacterium]|nr:hypothetical protein [Deltaproteobacteria bacterium]